MVNQGFLQPAFRELVTELGKSGAKILPGLKERGPLDANAPLKPSRIHVGHV